jgi:hypothetical protein
MGEIALICALFLLRANPVALGISQLPSQLRVSGVHYDRKLPLVEALRAVGLHVKGGFVSFGVDISGNTEPEVDLDMPDTTLSDALQRITSQIPGYASEVVSEHVVEIYPAAERANPEDLLNLPVREFSVKGTLATTIFSSPALYIPDMQTYVSKDRKNSTAPSNLGCGRLKSDLKSNAVGVTLSLTGRTVRQILDAVAEADATLPISAKSSTLRLYPVGWVHRRTINVGTGVSDAWSSMSFVPHDWKLHVAK